MEKAGALIKNLLIIGSLTFISSTAARFLINLSFANEYELLSTGNFILCVIVPVIFYFMNKIISRKKLIILSLVYPFCFTILNYWI